jgi:exosortase
MSFGRRFLMNARFAPAMRDPRSLAAVGLTAALLWAYWPTFAYLAEVWSDDPQYSHGYLVPAFALALLWSRRERLALADAQPRWWGLLVLLAGAGLRLAGAYYHYVWFDAASLLPMLVGVALVVGGWPVLRWSWPAIAFLMFMIPLPFRLQSAMGARLQHVATLASTYALQTCGYLAYSEGNIIVLNQAKLNVEEACSGLSMLIVFFALSTAIAVVARRPLLDKLVIAVSALPIAIIANVVRIVATGILMQLGKSREAHLVFHNLAGWLMMLLALGILGIELRLLGRLLVPYTPAASEPLALVPSRRPGARALASARSD